MSDAPTRPDVPAALQHEGSLFLPSRELYDFARFHFIEEGGLFWRPEYQHLADARIGVLWTNVLKTKGMRTWAASAELVTYSGDKWAKGRERQQDLEWFGDWFDGEPINFRLTFFAPCAMLMNDVGICATVAHELRHCAQKEDQYGEPQFDVDERPRWAMRDHDVTAWLSVAEDFGPVEPNVPELMEILSQPPRFPGAIVEGICGVCDRAVL